jgi:hypothetical protein
MYREPVCPRKGTNWDVSHLNWECMVPVRGVYSRQEALEVELGGQGTFL